MNCDKKHMLLYAVTDRAWLGDETLAQQVEKALKGGVSCVQLREKNLSDEEFLAEAIKLSALCKSYDVPFIINDNIDIAIKCDASGVHIGQSDTEVLIARKKIGDNMILGVSAQTVAQAKKAQADGADYLGVGAVFETSTKLDANAVKRETLIEIAQSVDIPIVAIGGITKENIPLLKGCGIDGVAVVSAIFKASDISAECKELREIASSIL